MKKINFNIIFDLDGTLVHSVPDMHYAINKTLTKYSLKNISEEKLQTFVGEGMLSLSKKVVFALDSDQAGHEATKRINHFFLKEGITGRHISFHPQKDPDEFLNENNAIDLETRIKDSIPFIDTELKRMRTERLTQTC